MMTSKCAVVLILAFSWIEGLSAASYSNVLVQRGPLEYINYNPSALSFGPQLAQLSSGSLQQIPLPAVSSIMSPCVSPCVIPNGPIQALAPLHSNANAKIVTYKSSLPNVPVLLANKDVARGYQYAYAVFDEQTGDKKTQSEHSDGSVVHGQYSFIQPDGFRRVVVYTADDLKGFNAVVKNISPEPEHSVEEKPEPHKEEEVKPASPPCSEAKNEHLTESHDSHDSHGSHDGHEEAAEEKHPNIEHEHVEEKSEEITEKHNEIEEETHNEAHPHEELPPHEEPHQIIINADQNTNIPNNLLSYNDIINCLQAKLKGARNVISPLTYVLIPSSRSPC